MDKSQIIESYFPALTALQQKQFALLVPLYQECNEKINFLPLKAIANLSLNHTPHSLPLSKVISFKPGAEILDVGTGGGFPGVPLAILFPESNFHLVDSIGKKITVVKAVAEGLGLKNVKAQQVRVEEMKGDYDFIVSRAVAR